MYDIAALLNQQLQNSQLTYYNNFQDAYREKDLETFNENAEKFLESISLVDQISATQKDELLGNWIGKANERSADYDDFSEDAFEFNAKALITTWGGRNCAKTLGDYAYRQYAGLEEDYVKPLRLSADKQELDEIVAQAGALNENDYTSESWNALSNALAGAKEILEGNPTQEEVDAAVNALQEAIKGLEAVNKGEDPTTPEDPGKPAGGDDTDKPAEKEPDKGQSAVETGNFTDIRLFAGMMFVSLAAVCCLGYRKKHF